MYLVTVVLKYDVDAREWAESHRFKWNENAKVPKMNGISTPVVHILWEKDDDDDIYDKFEADERITEFDVEGWIHATKT